MTMNNNIDTYFDPQQSTYYTTIKSGGSCGQPCEVWSRVCGYFRPVSIWNRGKKEEFRERKPFAIIR